MYPNYSDIRNRIDETPKWYTQHGVPRYESFTPDLASDIYATHVLLAVVYCQSCGERFYVEMVYSYFDADPRLRMKRWLERENADRLIDWSFHYGDPPAHGCVGDTMNSLMQYVCQFWSRKDQEWVRHDEFEVKTPSKD